MTTSTWVLNRLLCVSVFLDTDIEAVVKRLVRYSHVYISASSVNHMISVINKASLLVLDNSYNAHSVNDAMPNDM